MDNRDDNTPGIDRPIATENDAHESIGSAIADERTIPSINRKKTGSKLITIAGIIFIIIVGGILIVMINGGHKKGAPPPAEKKTTAQVGNSLPPLTLPAPAAPAPIAAPTNVANDASGSPGGDKTGGGNAGNLQGAHSGGSGGNNKKLDWRDRKMLASASSGGSLSSRIKSSEPTTVAPEKGEDGAGKSELALALEPTQLKGVSASMLKNREFLLTKGSTLDLSLRSAMDSTLAGIVTAVLNQDVYSDLGVKLLARGTKFTGEYSGGVKQGQARIGTVWSRAETPEGVIIGLNSPGTDALGRAGLEGWVDKHFAERFGAAIMLSLFKDTTGYIIAGQDGGGAVMYGSNTVNEGDKLAEKALDSSINIPNTIIKNQGDHIQIMVARDLDFSTVYELRSNE